MEGKIYRESEDIKKIVSEAIYRRGNLLLKPFTQLELTHNYASWFHDKVVTRFNSHGIFPYTTKQMEKFVAKVEQGFQENTEHIFAVYIQPYMDEKNKLKHIGNVSLQSINMLNRSGELAWLIGAKEEWGKGYATIAGELLLAHAIEGLNLRRVWVGVAEKNIGMIRVCEKLGMQREGIQREALYSQGHYHNIIMFGGIYE